MSKTITVLLTLLFIIFPEQIKKGALIGINNGIFILLPSIFPYITIAQMFLKTGAADTVSDFTYKFTKSIFRFSKDFSGAYLISLFCGYPTGARLACELSEGREREAVRLFSFGNIPGFGFCTVFLGTLFNNIRTGTAVYLCFVFSSLILNYIFSFFLNDVKKISCIKRSYKNISEALTESVKESSIAMLAIIGFAVFFSGISKIISLFVKNERICAIFSAFCEITVGVSALKETFGLCAPLIIFFTGFSGLSVIFQSFSFKKSRISFSFVIFARIIFALLSVLLFYIYKLF